MCSFLLLFLILIVGFDFLRDSTPHWNAEASRSATETGRSQILVLTPQRSTDLVRASPHQIEENFISPSFEGSTFHQKMDQQIEQQEIWPWRCGRCQRINKKTAMKCAICNAHWTSGSRHSTQPKQSVNSQRDAARWQDWEEWSQDWDDNWGDPQEAWQWTRDRSQMRSHSQASTRSNRSEPHQANGRKSRNKGKGKGKQGKGTGKDVSGSNLSPSPFTALAPEMPPWPPLESSTNAPMPSVAPISAAQVTETIAQKREVLGALRAAYTDQSLIPSDTKELITKLEAEIERLEKEFTKATTKNLHSATKALGKAQKTLTETLEAKRVHRARWTKHVAEAAKAWEGQLHEYRQQQSSLQEVATKARADIESARSAIQSLSAKATPATLAAMPPITAITAETEDLTGDADVEEESAQQLLQSTLRSCAASLGVDLNMPTASQMASEEIEENAVKDQARQKRARSMEPFAGGGPSLPAPGGDGPQS